MRILLVFFSGYALRVVTFFYRNLKKLTNLNILLNYYVFSAQLLILIFAFKNTHASVSPINLHEKKGEVLIK